MHRPARKAFSRSASGTCGAHPPPQIAQARAKLCSSRHGDSRGRQRRRLARIARGRRDKLVGAHVDHSAAVERPRRFGVTMARRRGRCGQRPRDRVHGRVGEGAMRVGLPADARGTFARADRADRSTAQADRRQPSSASASRAALATAELGGRCGAGPGSSSARVCRAAQRAQCGRSSRRSRRSEAGRSHAAIVPHGRAAWQAHRAPRAAVRRMGRAYTVAWSTRRRCVWSG